MTDTVRMLIADRAAVTLAAVAEDCQRRLDLLLIAAATTTTMKHARSRLEPAREHRRSRRGKEARMTDVSYNELITFAGYWRRRSTGPRARGVQRVLDLAPGCASADELLALIERDPPGDVRDAASQFIGQFSVQVRDNVLDALVEARRLRDAHLPVDPETGAVADTAAYKEGFLAGLIAEADMRDAVKGMVARLNAEDEANGRPPFSWLSPR